MNKFLHLGVDFGGLQISPKMDSTLNSIATDWIQYAPNNWLLWTNRMPSECSYALRSALTLNDRFTLFVVNPDTRDGFHYQWIWNWIDSKYKQPPPQQLPSNL